MANITTELSRNNLVTITFAGRQAKHLRLTDGWTDWMLAMDDFRDLIIPLTKEDTDSIITELLNNPNKLRFTIMYVQIKKYLSTIKSFRDVNLTLSF